MKADIDDAPQRINRARSKRSVYTLVLCLPVVAIATLVAFQFISPASIITFAYTRSMAPMAQEQELMSPAEMIPRQDLQSDPPPAPSGVYPPENGFRQTVFNDRNFTPRGADNVVHFQVGANPLPKKEPPKEMKLTIVRQSPSMKDRACGYLRRGSLESRNCRTSIGLNYRD